MPYKITDKNNVVHHSNEELSVSGLKELLDNHYKKDISDKDKPYRFEFTGKNEKELYNEAAKYAILNSERIQLFGENEKDKEKALYKEVLTSMRKGKEPSEIELKKILDDDFYKKEVDLKNPNDSLKKEKPEVLLANPNGKVLVKDYGNQITLTNRALFGFTKEQRDTRDKALEVALKNSVERFGQPLMIDGNRKYISHVVKKANEMGISLDSTNEKVSSIIRKVENKIEKDKEKTVLTIKSKNKEINKEKNKEIKKNKDISYER